MRKTRKKSRRSRMMKKRRWLRQSEGRGTCEDLKNNPQKVRNEREMDGNKS